MDRKFIFQDKDDEPVVSMRFDANASVGLSEEVKRALNVSLKQIDTHRAYKVHTFLIGQVTDSGGVVGSQRSWLLS